MTEAFDEHDAVSSPASDHRVELLGLASALLVVGLFNVVTLPKLP